MTTVQALYSGSGAGTSITWTSAGTLANAAAAGCLAIDNTSNLYLDAAVYIAVGIGTTAAPRFINLWAAASEDGTNYTSNSATTDAYSGADAAVTLGLPPVFLGPFYHPTQQNSVTAKIIIPSIRDMFGGLILPKKWGLIIENQSGAAFTSLSAEYRGYKLTNV
jgi:hypothetical protein